MEKTKYFTFAGRILKNLFKKPATTQYPFEPADYPARMRGHVEIKIEDCITCGLCARACPSLAIQVDRKAGTWTISRDRLPEELSDYGKGIYGAGYPEKE